PATPYTSTLPYTTLFRSVFPRQYAIHFWRGQRRQPFRNFQLPRKSDRPAGHEAGHERGNQPEQPRQLPESSAASLQLLYTWHVRSEEHTSELQSRENLVC